MHVGFHNFYSSLSRANYCFQHTEAPIGDELLAPFVDLSIEGRKRGVRFDTLDMVPDLSALDAIVFADFPDLNEPLVRRALATNAKKILITFECEVIKLDNWFATTHAQFDRVLTWHDGFVADDPKCYTKINFSQRLTSLTEGTHDDLCALIASNKRSHHPLELYSARREAISWFTQHHPEEFDLWGPGWRPSPTYRGTCASKRRTLAGYRFSICFENAIDIPGYITEKVFDCFLAGCVPVYWGAPNVTDYIPTECFIDARSFDSYEDLYSLMVNMPESQRLSYVESARRFLSSEAGRKFSTEHFAQTVLGAL